MSSPVKSILLVVLVSTTSSCIEKSRYPETPSEDSFISNVEFLKRFTDVIVLSSADEKMLVAVSPALQGRVMTSSANGRNGRSFGWINRKAFTSGDTSTHMNAFGGEDRLWLGPEGGQFSIYFEKGKQFDFENWHVPALIDLQPFDIISSGQSSATFGKKATLKNYSDAKFDIEINRNVQLITASEIAQILGMNIDDSISVVAYRSINSLKNSGDREWNRETGLLSLWILGMYNPSENVTIIIPFNKQNTADSSIVNDRYFGKVPSERLAMKKNVVLFRGDGKYRSKIGLRPEVARPWLGSFDPDNMILTLVHYNKPADAREYVNSFWEIQKEPYKGDVINAYNDGPPSPGAPAMGPFYELETSSPAAALRPGDSLVHIHTTFHFQGDREKLDRIATEILGISLKELKD